MALTAQVQPVATPLDATPVTRYAPADRRTFSLRWIATSLAVVLSASAAVSVGFISERNARLVLMEEIQTRLVLQARNLAAGSAGGLLTNFPELTIQPLVRAIMDQQHELAFAVVLDNAGKIVGHPESRALGTVFQGPAGLVPARTAGRLERGELLKQSPRLLVAESPILTPDHRVLGATLVAIDRTYVEGRLERSRRQQILVTIACLILSVGLSFMLMSRLLHPLSTLRKGLQRIGRGDLETPIRLHDRTELGTLAHAMNEMAHDLKRAQEVMIAQGRLEHEVDIARQIQRSLLPSSGRRVGNAFVCGDQRSATEVGGDYYDFILLPDGRLALAIADVSGKGLPGCLVMAMLSAALHALRGAEESPSQLLVRLDAQFAESLRPGTFVTMFYGILDPRTGAMTWASAGHNPMLVYRATTGTVERSESRGIPIGALRGGLIRRTLEDQTLRLDPGDVMVHCTDGYTEAMHVKSGEMFGLDRLAEIVRRHGSDGPQQVIDALIERVQSWTGGGALRDDETLLVVGWGPNGLDSVGVEAADQESRPGLDELARARRTGYHAELSASRESVRRVTEWMRSLPRFERLSESDDRLLNTAIVEVITNIAEHGLGYDANQRFDLWWSPPENFEQDPSESPTEAARRYVATGVFVARDHGQRFSPDNWKATDFNDPRARARGRGFGLDIIFRVMRRAEYYPGTASGNITVLAFGAHSDDNTWKREDA